VWRVSCATCIGNGLVGNICCCCLKIHWLSQLAVCCCSVILRYCVFGLLLQLLAAFLLL
jgi:hypothetical protein